MFGVVACNQTAKTNEESKKDTLSLVKKTDSVVQDTGKITQKIQEPEVKKNRETKTPFENQKKRNAMIAYNQGIQFYQKGDLESALEQFKKSLENDPDNGNTSHYLARIYYDMGQKQLALSYYKDAARFNENDSVSTLGIGQVYFDMGDQKNAMMYYNRALEMAPNYALAYYNRGTLLGMQNKYIDALDDLNKSIDLDTTNGNAFVNRGLAYFYLKQMNSACRDWRKAAKMGFEKAQKAVDQYCE